MQTDIKSDFIINSPYVLCRKCNIMGCNVFGEPITDKLILRGMEEYEKYTVKQWERARAALEGKNEGDKDTKARQYVEKLRQEWGDRACTLCLIYNATGSNVVLVTTHDFHGRIGHGPYPIMIENGQWGAFLHGRTPQEYTGSSAAVVYRGKNREELPCDWMLAWSNPWDRFEWKNKAYTEIGEATRYQRTNDVWNTVSSNVNESGTYHSNMWNGCASYVSIGNDNAALLEAILTLKDAIDY